MEAEIWRDLQAPAPIRDPQVSAIQDASKWLKPPNGWVKCNFASSWVDPTSRCGGAWIVRDANGNAIFHSRRSLQCFPNPLEAELASLLWTLEDMANLRVDKVIFESSSIYIRSAFSYYPSPGMSPMIDIITQRFHGFKEWCTELVLEGSNKVASLIAVSVTRDHRLRSYVGSGGPSWLQSLILHESRNHHS
ncbi:hypothetical protein Bca4012_010697 [Brassica carinata]|uniref:RNase H type-1 domain-containing protein n=1 Tax=Brassica carinata TaxID=52824 RepID=A0A8X7VYY4_BRACI|nr:hypothetical protein Bca52824_012473 [Brassica carinata]